MNGVNDVRIVDGLLHVHVDMGIRTEIARTIKLAGGTISRFEEEGMNLQKVFLKLIGNDIA